MKHLDHPSPHFNDAKMARFCSFAPSLLAGGYWGFHRGKPVPFGNRPPSWIFEARAPGYERASAKIEGVEGGREEENRRFFTPLPAPLPSLTLSTLYPAQTWPREFKMATSLRIPAFFRPSNRLRAGYYAPSSLL